MESLPRQMTRMHIGRLSTWRRWRLMSVLSAVCCYQQDAGGAERARDTGLPASTYLFQLGTDGIGGLLGSMIPYKYKAVLDSGDDRRRALIGDTTAAVWANAFVSSVPAKDGAQWSDEFYLRVYVSPTPQEASLVYRRDNPRVQSKVANWSPSWLFYDAPQDISQNFQLAGKSWYIAAQAASRIFTKKNAGSILVLILGCLPSFYRRRLFVLPVDAFQADRTVC